MYKKKKNEKKSRLQYYCYYDNKRYRRTTFIQNGQWYTVRQVQSAAEKRNCFVFARVRRLRYRRNRMHGDSVKGREEKFFFFEVFATIREKKIFFFCFNWYFNNTVEMNRVTYKTLCVVGNIRNPLLVPRRWPTTVSNCIWVRTAETQALRIYIYI